jgi:hypothetical protein
MTDDQAAQFTRHLGSIQDKTGKPVACPICQSTDNELGGMGELDRIPLGLFTGQANHKAHFAGQCAQLVCKSCGYVMLFANRVVGIQF